MRRKLFCERKKYPKKNGDLKKKVIPCEKSLGVEGMGSKLKLPLTGGASVIWVGSRNIYLIALYEYDYVCHVSIQFVFSAQHI